MLSSRRLVPLFASLSMFVFAPPLRAQTWSGFGPGLGDWVYAAAEFGGDLVVGGKFTTAGGAPANHVARWDGAGWSALGSGVDGDVWALCVYQGELYAAGDFYTAGGNVVSFVARWDGVNWNEMSGGTNSSVRTMCVWNGLLVVGGYFTSADGPANHVAAWDGSDWAPLGAGTGGSQGQVLGLCALGADLYATGFFTTAGGAPANRIAKWNGATWSPLGAGLSGIGYALTAWNGGVVAGGGFGAAGGVPASDVAFWNGATWTALGAGVGGGTYGLVLTLGSYNGELVAGGIFTTAGGRPAPNLARWNGAAWTPGAGSMASGGTVNGVYATTLYAGSLVVGGIFYSVDGASNIGNVAAYEHSFVPYGAGCPGTGGLVPALFGLGVARSGYAAGVEVLDGLPNGLGAFGFATASASDPLFGCTLWIGGVFLPLFDVVLDGGGTASASFAIPPGVLPGTRLYAQYVGLDAGAANGVFTVSNGLEIVFH